MEKLNNATKSVHIYVAEVFIKCVAVSGALKSKKEGALKTSTQIHS